jgi:hypothetical protein
MYSRTGVAQALVQALGALLIVPTNALYAREQGNKKPSLSLKASPAISFAPARIVLVAEVKGGANDFEDFYCPSVDWDWGDETNSVADTDCEPYQPGKSEIKRRYTVEHRYKNEGTNKNTLKLKKGARIVASANAQVQVRSGLTGGR